MAQAGSRCGSWIVSTPETALRSAGDLVDVGCCRAPEGDASTERIARWSSHAPLGGDPRRRSSSRRATTACCASRSTPTAGSSARTITDPGVLEEQASATRARGYASEMASTATGSGRSRRPRATRRKGRSPRSSPAATRQVRRSRKRIRYRDTAPVLGADPGILDELLETFAADELQERGAISPTRPLRPGGAGVRGRRSGAVGVRPWRAPPRNRGRRSHSSTSGSGESSARGDPVTRSRQRADRGEIETTAV
jgi:hypothetical protein